LLLPKLKRDLASGSVFSQIFYSGSRSWSERKKQNPAVVYSGNPDAVRRVVATAPQPEPASRLRSAMRDVSLLWSDSRCRRYV